MKIQITDIPESQPERDLIEREKDTKEIVVGGKKFTIIPMSEPLKAESFRVNRKARVKLHDFLTKELGYSLNWAEELREIDSKPLESRTEEEKEQLQTFNSDFSYTQKATHSTDWTFVEKVLDDCIVDAEVEEMQSGTAKQLVKEIENHSNVSDSDRLVL